MIDAPHPLPHYAEYREVERQDIVGLSRLITTSESMGPIYERNLHAHRLPQSELKVETDLPPSSRFAKFKEAGLVGCFNDSGVTSRNYKDVISKEFGSGSSSRDPDE